MLDICLLGTGGMMPLPYRWLTAMYAKFNGSGLLIDCGEGTQIAIREKGWGTKQIDVICFTHYHADHISGLPGLLLTMGNAERTEPLLIIGPKGLERIVNALCMIAPGLPFEIQFHELTEPEEVLELHGYRLTAFKVNHSVTCYAYVLEVDRAGRFSVESANAHAIPQKYWSKLQKGEIITDGEATYTPDMVLGPARKGLKVTYCTDTRPIPSIAEHAAGSDLFICEGMYGEPDKEADARQKKHMTFFEAARLGKEADAQELWLTHYSPSLTYAENFIGGAKEIFDRTVAAKDGMSVTLRFEED